MTKTNNGGLEFGYEAADIERVRNGPKLAVVQDERPRPPSELRIYFMNLADRLVEMVTPRRLSLAELNAKAKLPPKGTKVETLAQPTPVDCELDANYSLLPRQK